MNFFQYHDPELASRDFADFFQRIQSPVDTCYTCRHLIRVDDDNRKCAVSGLPLIGGLEACCCWERNLELNMTRCCCEEESK